MSAGDRRQPAHLAAARVGTPREVGAALVAHLEAGLPSVLVTLLARDGHGYAEPGAQLVLGWDAPAPPVDGPPPAPVAGRLSGGCLEAEVAARAREVRPGTPARTWRLDLRDDDPLGLGVACGGVLTVLAEAVDPAGPDAEAWRAWAEATADGRPARRWGSDAGTAGWAVQGASYAATVAPEALRRAVRDAPLARAAPDVRARLHAVAGGWAHVAPAAPELVVTGADGDAVAVARTLTAHGWTVTLVDPARAAVAAAADAVEAAAGRRPDVWTCDARALEARTVPPGAWALAASHRLELDAALVATAARDGARWVGAIGSDVRAGALRAAAEAVAGDGPSAVRLEAPAGMAIGARGPEEIATAVAARLVADLRAATAPVWAVVPAAGAATRMGAWAGPGKPLLRDGAGETLLARAVRLAEATCDGAVVVAQGGSAVADAVAPPARLATVPDAGGGLRASLRAGVRAAPEGARVLVLLPDMPGVDAAHLVALRRAADRAVGAASRYPDGRLGAPAVLPAPLVARLRGEGDGVVPTGGGTPDRGLAADLAAIEGVAAVALADAGDVDAPADAQARGLAPGPDGPIGPREGTTRGRESTPNPLATEGSLQPLDE